MNGISVFMAIVDFIPVALFFAAAVILQRDLYNKAVKGAFALLAAGSIMVLVAGIYKALWKLLYALNICDFTALDIAFFPMQAPGFLLVFLALVAILSKKRDAALPAVVPVFGSSLPFVGMQTLGCGGMQWCLFAIGLRMKRKGACALFVLSFIAMLGMGYLSAKFDDSSNMHWVAQLTNTVSQGALLLGTILLHRAGLANADALDKAVKA